MLNEHQVFLQLRNFKKKGSAIKVKISHENDSFVARVEQLLPLKEVVTFTIESSLDPCQRSIYYFDEIESIQPAGFSFSNPFRAIRAGLGRILS